MLKTSQLRIQDSLERGTSGEMHEVRGDELQQDRGLGVMCVTCRKMSLKRVPIYQYFPTRTQNLICLGHSVLDLFYIRNGQLRMPSAPTPIPNAV